MINVGFLRRYVIFALGCALVATRGASAQQNASPHLPVLTTPPGGVGTPAPLKSSLPDYGTSKVTFVEVGAAAFTPMDSSNVYTTTNSGYFNQVLRTVTGNFVFFAAPINIPSGAIVKYLELDECDNTGGSGFVQGSLVESDYLGNVTAFAPFLSSDGLGCKYLSEDVTPTNMVSNNILNHFWLLSTVSSMGGFTTGLAGMIVGYQLQVSPAPGTATFTDVPLSDFAFQFIEAFNAAGITVGCNASPPQFCPDRNVTRREMAVFFAKALGLQFQ